MLKKKVQIVGLLCLLVLFSFTFISARFGYDNPTLPNIEEEQIITYRNITDTNSSDFWDNLNTPADILGSWINNDLGWINWTKAINGTLALSSSLSNYLLNTGDTATGNYTFDGTTFHIDSTNNRVGIGTTAPNYKLEVNGSIVPTMNLTYDLGTADLRWRDLYLSNSSIYLGSAKISAVNNDEINVGALHIGHEGGDGELCMHNQGIPSPDDGLQIFGINDTGEWILWTQTPEALNRQIALWNTSVEFNNVTAEDITAGGNIIASVGAVATPSIYFGTNSDTGMYYIHPDKIGFAIGGNPALRLDSYGVMIIDGVANAPSYSFLNDDDSGFYRIGTDNIGLALNGIKRVDFAVAGTTVTGNAYLNNTLNVVNGRVGVGTSLPDSVFHIKANIAGSVGSHSAGQIIIQNPADSVFSNVVITAYESDGNGDPDQQLWYLGSSSSSSSDIIFLNRRNAKLKLGTSGSTRMTILGNGDVGFGTTDPQNTLNVIGITNSTTGFAVQGYLGYSGYCVNTTYLGGLAISCND